MEEMLWAAAIGLALLLVAAWQLNPLCVKLMPLAAFGILLYPLCKRFTWLVHFVLGAVDALAPLGAFIGVSGTVTVPALLLFVAVTVWVAGFDIIYALMDVGVDRAQGIKSIPAQFGERSAAALPLGLHTIMLVALGAAGALARAGWPYAAGLLIAGLLIGYEARLLRAAANVFVLNQRVFVANMAFSVAFLATTLAGFTLGM